MATTNFELPLLHQNQAMKEVIVNESLLLIDGLLNKAAVDIVEDLPEDVSEGEIYIKKEGEIASFINNRWHTILPKNRMIFYVTEQESFAIYYKGIWKLLKNK